MNQNDGPQNLAPWESLSTVFNAALRCYNQERKKITMSNIMKKTAATAHGEIEYETVECSSCGDTVAKESAKRHVVGTVQDITHWGVIGHRTYEFDTSDYQEGWVCECCRNDGVVDFPLKSVSNLTVAKFMVIVAAVALSAGFILGGVF